MSSAFIKIIQQNRKLEKDFCITTKVFKNHSKTMMCQLRQRKESICTKDCPMDRWKDSTESLRISKEHLEALITLTISETESSGQRERTLIYWLYQRSLKMLKPGPARNGVHIIRINVSTTDFPAA